MAYPPYQEDKEKAYLEWLRHYLTEKLTLHVTAKATAQALGIDRANLYRLIRKAGVPLPQIRRASLDV